MKAITIALAGNPNSGKTTIFNNLTGARQHVGNYPGVTVEKKEGRCTYEGRTIHVVDLPGTYCLAAYSTEEILARDFVIEERPDVVVDILDASNLERNLYLATQFMELGVPLVLALNMSDVAKRRGFDIDIERISELFGAPMVPTVGHKNRGTRELLQAALAVAGGEAGGAVKIHYGKEIEDEIDKIHELLQGQGVEMEGCPGRWLALKLLENDEEILKKVKTLAGDPAAILATVGESSRHIERIFNDIPEIIIAERRYGFISGACQEAVKSSVEFRHTLSDKVDFVITHSVLGLPIFLAMMFMIFYLVFSVGDVPAGWIDSAFGWLGGAIGGMWPGGSESLLKSLIVDGIIGGVGGVIVFLPNIMLLFLAISILEDSGYMARAAFIMDRVMHKIGLHGKSFIPLLIGLGCTVPAVMATRTLDTRRDRMTTMLIAPLISCSARQIIYLMLIPAFFAPAWHAPMLWIIYIIGIIIAVVAAKLLRSTLFKGESTPFVMELPPYRMPTLRGALLHMWERSWLYVKKAGTIILVISILLWALGTFPRKTDYDVDYAALAENAGGKYIEEVVRIKADLALPDDYDKVVEKLQADLTGSGNAGGRDEPDPEIEKCLGAIKSESPQGYETMTASLEEARASYESRIKQLSYEKKNEELAYSAAGRIGHFLEPALGLMGFDWRIGTALIGAFAAKEVFVAQMGIVYSLGEAETEEGSQTLRETLRANYSPLIGFCIMLFILISMPCMATVAVTKREANSWSWALFQLAALTALAFVLTVIVYQAGSLLGIGAT